MQSLSGSPGPANLDAPIVTGERSDDAAIMPCVTYNCTLDLVVTTVSSNCLELIGIRPENILGQRSLWQERLPLEDRDRLISRLNQLNWTEVASVDHKIADDRGLQVSVAHSFRKVKTGDEVRIVGCMVPLIAGEFPAARLNDSVVSQFIHKIGNHFQLINFLIGSLKRTGTNIDEIESLQATVDRAVEFTRALSHYCQAPVFTPAGDLVEILHTAIESIAPSFGEKKVALRDRIEKRLNGAMIDGDPYLLKLAMTALLENALDATQSGNRVVVSGRLAERSEDRSIARIAIVDNGCGMEKNMLTKAADPFVTTKRDRDGLGLSTAVRIVELHRGRLTISSSAGKGTKVEILLPVTFTAGTV